MTSTLLPATQDDATASLPGLIDRAAAALTGARSAAEVLEAREMAALAYDAAKRAARIGKAKKAHDSLIAAAHRAQADAHEIQALASRRLADEYDAAQERGEIGQSGSRTDLVPNGNEVAPSAADIGLSRKDIHEARLIRDAEQADPGIVRRALDEALAAGEEPTRAKVRRAVLQTARPEQPATPTRGKAAVCQRVREAIVLLSGLPEAAEVVGYFRDSDSAIIVSEKLPAVSAWVEQFAAAWEIENA